MSEESNRRKENRSDESEASNATSTSTSTSIFSPAATVSSARTSLGSTSAPVELPDPESKEALMYCGFTEEMATTIFNRWNVPEVREEFEWELFNFAVRYLRSHNRDTCGEPEDDWDAYLQKCGADEQVRMAITRPGHDDVRYTQTARYWFIWSLEEKYAYLKYMKEVSKGYGDKVREQQRAQAGDTSGSTPGQPTSARSQGGDTANSPSAPPTAFVGRSGRVFSPRVASPGKTVLWKGCGRMRVEECWRKSFRQGLYRFDNLISQKGGDFSPIKELYYFTNAIAGAQHYARYVTGLASRAGVCLVSIELPNQAIENARPYLLNYPSDEFKKAVWYSRRVIDFREVSDQDLVAVHQAQFLIGDTCNGTRETYENMDHWSNIGPRRLVMLPRTPTENDPREEEPMKQYAFDRDFALGLSAADKTITIHRANDPDVVLTEGIDFAQY